MFTISMALEQSALVFPRCLNCSARERLSNHRFCEDCDLKHVNEALELWCKHHGKAKMWFTEDGLSMPRESRRNWQKRKERAELRMMCSPDTEIYMILAQYKKSGTSWQWFRKKPNNFNPISWSGEGQGHAHSLFEVRRVILQGWADEPELDFYQIPSDPEKEKRYAEWRAEVEAEEAERKRKRNLCNPNLQNIPIRTVEGKAIRDALIKHLGVT